MNSLVKLPVLVSLFFNFWMKHCCSGRPLVWCPCMSLGTLIFFLSLLRKKKKIELTDHGYYSASYFKALQVLSQKTNVVTREDYVMFAKHMFSMPVRIFSNFRAPLPVRVVIRENLPGELASTGKRVMAKCLLTDIWFWKSWQGNTAALWSWNAPKAQSLAVCCRQIPLHSLLPK